MPRIENATAPTAFESGPESSPNVGGAKSLLGVPVESATALRPESKMRDTYVVGNGRSEVPLRPDPERMQRILRDAGLVPTRDSNAEIETLSGASDAHFGELFRPESPERDQLLRLARVIRPEAPAAIVRVFISALRDARRRRPSGLRRRDQGLDPEWFLDPWYALDARNFWMSSDRKPGGFDAVSAGMARIAKLGFKNILLSNHYETEYVSGSRGVALHSPARELGDAPAFVRLLESARRLGLHVVTSAAFHRTSVLHPWFTAAGRPQAPQAEYYRQVQNAEQNRPFAMHVGSLRSGSRFMSSAPGLVELDLSSPALLGEVMQVLGDELNVGVLGKRSPALSQSAPGEVGHALRALLKLFMWGIARRSVLAIHSPLGCSSAASLVGPTVQHGAEIGTEQADLVYATELSIALRESLYAEDHTALQTWVCQLPSLPESSGLLAFVEDEKSVPLSRTSDPDLWRRMASDYHGMISPDGQRVAFRHGDAVGDRPDRVALSLFVLYMLPATPIVRYGTEIGATSAYEDHQREEARRLSFLRARAEGGERDVFYEEPPLLKSKLTANTHAQHLECGLAPVRLLSELNRRRRQDPALRSRTVSLIDVGERSVLAWLRGRGSHARLMLANLSGTVRRVGLPTSGLPESVEEALTAGAVGPAATADVTQGRADISLRPYGWAIA